MKRILLLAWGVALAPFAWAQEIVYAGGKEADTVKAIAAWMLGRDFPRDIE